MDVSNPDRIVYPDAGFTKADVVDHYERVAGLMLPHLAGSPLTLERYPRGIEAGGFMQKNAGAHFPKTIDRFETKKRDGTTTYPVVWDPADIAYLANQGTITFHAWTSRVAPLGRPVRIVIDLDPPAGAVALAREAASLVGEALASLALPCAPLATGSKGYHVIAPIAPATPHGDVATMCHGIAALLSADRPDLFTTEFRRAYREGRVFVDWLRNTPGATTVVPWSLRASPGAPVAVPIRWDELDATEPDRWRLDSVARRVDAADPIAELMADPPDATGAVAAVAHLVADRRIELEPFDRFRS